MTPALQLYSQTKLVAGIAVLQLVEAGVLSYDDPAIVEKYAPELWKQPVLLSFEDGRAGTEPRKVPLTLRHLLTHTSGLSYGFMSPLLMAYNTAHGLGKSYGGTAADLALPLLFQPGTKFGYGIGIDWAGIIVERASGLKLDEYFQKHIFDPLGLTEDDMTFFNRPEIVERWQRVTTRDAEGKLILTEPRRPLTGEPGQLSGGGGLWGTNKAYLTFLRGLLNCQNKAGLVSPEGFKLLFEDTLPTKAEGSTAHANLARMVSAGTTTAVDPALSDAETPGVGHSIALCVNLRDSPDGRRKGSGTWGGIATTEFWLDPSAGIAACGGTQYLRNRERGDKSQKDPFAKVWLELETTLYKYLEY